jgi:diguanylate cyclase (GGDEF)-like protein
MAVTHLAETSPADDTQLRIDQLADFAERLDLAPNEQELVALLLGRVRQVLHPAAVALLLVNEETLEFTLAQTLPKRGRRLWEAEFEAQIQAGTFAWGISQRQPVGLSLRAAPPRLPGARALVLAPLMARYHLLGALLVATKWPAEEMPALLVRDMAVMTKQFTLTLGTHRLVANLQRRNQQLALTGEELRRKLAELEDTQEALQGAIATQRQKTDELERLKSDLEAKVHERTAELRSLNKRLAYLSRTDELTGLLNRRSFDERLGEENERLLRSGRAATVVLADLNGLKAINDLHGHAAGDAALVATATVLQTVARSTDVVARLGGDEFAVLLTETGEAGAVLFCERVQRAAAAARWLDGQHVGLHLALGAAGCPPAVTLHEALNQADARMYADKRAYYRQVRTQVRTTT